LKTNSNISHEISFSAKKLFHADTRTDGRTDKHNVANSPFPKFLVWF